MARRTTAPFTELMDAAQLEKYRNEGSPHTEITSCLDVYRTDAVVRRSYKPACAGTVTEGKAIGGRPSYRSLQNLVFLLNNCDTPMTSMLTITMNDQVERRNPVTFHRKTLQLALQKLRDDGVNQYCWVREFQTAKEDETASVHWHVFTDLDVHLTPGGINDELGDRWRRWMVRRCRKGWCSESAAEKMLKGNRRDFKGCCRFEQLRSDAAGRYAGKEGAKRFQKKAPPRWVNGGAWWRASSKVKCSVKKTVVVDAKTLEEKRVDIGGGNSVTVIHKIQFGRGLKT